MQLLTKTCWVVLCATSCWVLTCEPVPSSAAVISGRPLPLCKLSRAGLHWRHIWFSPSKPPCFLERKTKFDLPHAGTMHTAAAAFPHLPKERTCPTVPAPWLSPNQRSTWMAQTVPAAGSRTEGWCFSFPRKTRVRLPRIFQLPLPGECSHCSKAPLLAWGAPAGAPGLWTARVMKALQWQDTCT